MRLPAFLRPVMIAALSLVAAHAAESSRVVVLQVPAASVAAVRTELSDAAKTAKPETMDAVMKRPGVEVLAEFKQESPWKMEPIDLRKDRGDIKFDGQVAETLGVELSMEGFHSNRSGTQENLTTRIKLPGGAKGYRGFDNVGNVMTLRSGKWTERTCWGDGKQTLMVWQFPVIEKAPVEEPADRWDSLRVEMRWLQAAAGDIAKATSSKPETREKAFTWLTGRAKLWKEATYRVRKNEKTAWMDADVKLAMSGGEVVAEQDHFSIETEVAKDGDALKINWTLEVTKKGDTTERKLSAGVEPGPWHFLPVEGIDGANVVAYRLTKD